MRKMDILITLVAGGLALAPANLKAQGAEQGLPTISRPQAGDTNEYSKSTGAAQSSSVSSNLKASNIIGLPVRNDAGENLGKVQDLIVNLQTHSVEFAIVGYGGTLGPRHTSQACCQRAEGSFPVIWPLWKVGNSPPDLCPSVRTLDARG